MRLEAGAVFSYQKAYALGKGGCCRTQYEAIHNATSYYRSFGKELDGSVVATEPSKIALFHAHS
jgi:hypothetical protein